MLIVDINTLQTVNLLYLGDDIVLNSLRAVYCKDIRRVDRALCKGISRLNNVAVMNFDLISVRDSISFLVGVFRYPRW